jgi:hypothetical protein
MTRFRTVKPLIVEAMQLTEPMDVNTGKEIVHAKPTDWIVRGPGGSFFACSDSEFKCTYENLVELRHYDNGSEGHECGC